MKKFSVIGLVTLITSTSAFAGVPSSFTYEGKLMNSAGTAPLSSVIILKLTVMDPSGACVLYEEQQSGIDLSQTNGLFAVQVGTPVGNSNRTFSGSKDPGLSMAAVFANGSTAIVPTGPNCSLPSGYIPATNDGRILRVSVTNGGSTTVVAPDLKIGSVPNAVVAETLQGLNLIQVMEPAGTVISFAGSICPQGYLTADGLSYPKVGTYASLFSAIGVNWGGDTNNFNVPDLRGRFVRGWDNGAGNDPDRATRSPIAAGGNTGDRVGSVQGDILGSHTHSSGIGYFSAGGPTYQAYTLGGYSGSTTIPAAGGNETRPKNANLNFCIKY